MTQVICTPRETQISPPLTSPSSRAATFTPSPKMSSSLTMTSPTLTPIRKRIRRPSGAFIRTLKRRLDLDRAADRVKNAGEFGEYTVAGSVRDPASMLRDQVIDNRAAGRQCHHRRFFVAMHQAAVTLDIRGEDCHQTSLERRSLHRYGRYPSIK